MNGYPEIVRVKVLFFGMLKDISGCREAEFECPAGARVGDVFRHYAALHPKLAAMEASVLLALNREFAAPDAPVEDGAELAFLPPVSGGADPPYTHAIEDPDGHFFALTRAPIDTRHIEARLLQGLDGAIATFQGVVRNNTKGRQTRFLDYEGYEPMAVETMARIGRDIASSLPISRIAMVHRLGRLEIGEASVAVVVTAPHRKPAFEAALEGINKLKQRVPIWKKEHFAGGEVWVEGEWDESLPRQS